MQRNGSIINKSPDKEQKSWEWPVNTVGRLVNNLKTLPPEMPFYTAYFVEINGVRVAKTTYPSLSRETVYEGKIQKFSAENTSLVLWASQEHPSARGGTFICPHCGADIPHQHVVDRKGNVHK